MKPILIIGLPGSGKTALAVELARLINAVHWNADDVRQNLNKDLGFSIVDRIEQARRMGWLCQSIIKANHPVIADFVCPLPECREAFGEAFTIFVDRVKTGRFDNTNKLFVPPEKYDIRIPNGLTIQEEVSMILLNINFMKNISGEYVSL